MKICLINTLYRPYLVGGTEVHVEALVKELAKDHQIYIITTCPFQGLSSLRPVKSVKDGVIIYRFFPAFYPGFLTNFQQLPRLLRLWHRTVDLWNPHSYLVVRQLLKQIKPDVVHTHNVLGLSTAVFSAVRSLELPHVHTIHDYQLLSPWARLFRNNELIDLDRFSIPEKVYQSVRRGLSRSIQAAISPSQFILDLHLKSGFFVNRARHVIPAGFKLSTKKSETRKSTTINLLYLGQLAPHKGVETILKAFQATNKKTLRLNIAGAGELEPRVNDLAAKDERVSYHGFVEGKVKDKLWSETDILVLGSVWYENMPLVAMEALSWGVPVIATQIGGIPEIVNEKNGWLFSPGDEGELKELFERLEKKTIRQKSGFAREKCQSFAIESVCQKILEIYRILI